MIPIISMLAIIFAVFAGSRVYLRYREGSTSWKEFVFWGVIWVAAIVIAIYPDVTFYFANMLGINRGIDLIVYVSIIAMFYLIFRLYVKIDTLEKDLTKIVRSTAIANAKQKKK